MCWRVTGARTSAYENRAWRYPTGGRSADRRRVGGGGGGRRGGGGLGAGGWVSRGGGGGALTMIPAVLLFGGVPFAIGAGMALGGHALIRSARKPPDYGETFE